MLKGRIDEAIEIGRRNREVIALGAAWCRHLKLDRSQMGIGLVEQQTGLPISGGTFTCDHARGRSPHGMQLHGIALDFYQRNCKGCTKRDPTGLLDNLGTWAEKILAEREREAQLRAVRAEEKRQERAERHKRWRLKVGTEATTQSIIDLLERLDSADKSDQAGEDLVALASLSPSSFSTDLINVLIEAAEQCRLSDCLDALIVLHEQGEGSLRPKVKDLSMRALREGWSSREARRIVAGLAEREDLIEHEPAIAGAISLAAHVSTPFMGSSSSPQPETLHRFLTIAPEQVEEAIANHLRQDESEWSRACAASVAGQLISSGHDMGPRLLLPLFDALKISDDERYHYGAHSHVARAVSRLLLKEPLLVDRAVDSLWPTADRELRCALIKCYDIACRDRLSRSLPENTASSIGAQGLKRVLESDVEVAADAADLLALVCRYHARDLKPDRRFLESLVGGIAVLSSRRVELLARASSSAEEQMNRLGDEARLARCVHDLVEAAASIAAESPSVFWPECENIWDNTQDPELRRLLVTLAGKVARSFDGLPLALPIMYSALYGPDQSCRATALEALRELRWRDVEEVPDHIAEGVILGLKDKYLIVVSAAVGAVGAVPLPPERWQEIVGMLIPIAWTYASKRDNSRMVQSALRNAVKLTPEGPLRAEVLQLCLQIIDRMPRYDAADVLAHTWALEEHPRWVSSAIECLRPDDDPNYRELGKDDRERILKRLTTATPASVAPHVDRLVAIALLYVNGHHHWSLRIADALSCLGFYEAAARIADRAEKSIGLTTEQRPLKLYLLQSSAAHSLEAAIAQGDMKARDASIQRWKTAEGEVEKDEAENRDARRHFFEPFLSDEGD